MIIMIILSRVFKQITAIMIGAKYSCCVFFLKWLFCSVVCVCVHPGLCVNCYVRTQQFGLDWQQCDIILRV